MESALSELEKKTLLDLAYHAIQAAVNRGANPQVDIGSLPDRLQKPGASFVTLTRGGALRGCIGTLKHQIPLAQDVMLQARAAATDDPRFPPLQAVELSDTRIEISVLTTPEPLDYATAAEITAALIPGVDGVTIVQGLHKATFLPQVWEKVDSPEQFLSLLCQKALLPADAWKQGGLDISTYRVESFYSTPADRNET